MINIIKWDEEVGGKMINVNIDVYKENNENSAKAVKVTRENDENDDQKEVDERAVKIMVYSSENDDARNLPAEKSAEEETDAVNEYDASALFEVGEDFMFYSIEDHEVLKYEFEER